MKRFLAKAYLWLLLFLLYTPLILIGIFSFTESRVLGSWTGFSTKLYEARLQQYVNHELTDVQAGFRKGRGTRDQIANIH